MLSTKRKKKSESQAGDRDAAMLFLGKRYRYSCCSSIFSATIHNPPRTLFFALGKKKAENYLSLMATGMSSHLDGKLKQVPKALSVA